MHLVFLLIASLYTLFALSTYKDYGITADEELNYRKGCIWATYFRTPFYEDVLEREVTAAQDSPLLDKHNRIYSAALSVVNGKNYYEWYHLLNMAFGFILFACFYYLAYHLSGKVCFAILAVVMLFTTPRWLGHVPANPKDMPFAVLYFISLAAIYLFSTKKTPAKYLVLGVLFGLTQSLRIIGASLLLIFLLFELLQNKNLGQKLVDVIIVACVSGFATVLTFPYVGANVVRNALELIYNAQRFGAWDNTILFMGSFLTKYDRPLSYLPLWLIITTPLYVLVGFLLSSYYAKVSRFLQLLWLCVVVNFGLYFALDPVIYNGLRHFLYLLPVIVFAATLFFAELFSIKSKFRLPVLAFALLNFVLVCCAVIRLHPYQYVYFNELVGGLKGASDVYELDYWGASYKEAAEWLRTQPFSKVYACNVPAAMQYYSEGKFEMVGSSSEADFVVCDWDNLRKEGFSGKTVFEVTRFGVPLNVVLRGR